MKPTIWHREIRPQSSDKFYPIDYHKGFFRDCFGLILIEEQYIWQGVARSHVLFQFVVEDDGQWSTSGISGSSPAWLPELVSLTQEAQAWVAENCIKTEHGYAFKTEVGTSEG